VLASDELAAEPGQTFARVLEFLGAPGHELESYPRVYEQSYGEMQPDTRRSLAEYFAEPNRRLYELLGRDFGFSL